MKMAIVHDYLVQGIRGAERVLDVLHEMYPEAPVYTLLYDADRMEDRLRSWDIRTSLLQDIPGALRLYRKLFFLMPAAIDHLDLSEYDLVMSSSCGWSKSAPQAKGALHIAYVYSPARFLWFWAQEYIRTLRTNFVAKGLVRASLPPLRDWDRRTAQRPQHMVCISETTRRRLREAYQRDATIIYPPVDTERFVPANEDGEYFLAVATLNPYKRLDLAIEAFNRLRLPLVVIGDGPEYQYLKQRAGPTVQMLGKVPDEEIVNYYARGRAFIMPQEEDFGIAPLEAQSCGRPVVAYRAGGATETVIEGETGLFFEEHTPEALVEAVGRFEAMSFDKQACRNNALSFSVEGFKRRLGQYVQDRWEEHVKTGNGQWAMRELQTTNDKAHRRERRERQRHVRRAGKPDLRKTTTLKTTKRRTAGPRTGRAPA